MLEILAVSTGLSEDSTTSRLASRLGAATASAVAPAEARVTEINLRTLARDIVTMTLSGMPGPALEEAFAAVSRADALITVAPVYKTQPVGLHTLFFQLLDDGALAGTPVLIGATGGTARHSLAVDAGLRPLLSYLKGILVPSAVFAATDDWGADTAGHGTGVSPLQHRIDSAAGELADLLLALRGGTGGDPATLRAPGGTGEAAVVPEDNMMPRTAERHGGPVDAFDPNSVTPFAELLNR